MAGKKKNLGGNFKNIMPDISGIDILLPTSQSQANEQIEATGAPLMVNVGLIDPNPDQPRREFNREELNSLSQSILAKGIIEPLVVTKKGDGRFELIAGERRLKAAKEAKFEQVPVIVSDLIKEPHDRLVLALLENICRADLNPIEEAESFLRLDKEFNLTHQEIASTTGKERTTVTNAVRLLKLPEYVKDDIRFGRLSAGHGRAMLPLNDEELLKEVREEVIRNKLTVRQTELLVKKRSRRTSKKPYSFSEGDSAYFEALAKSFTSHLGGLKVKIDHSGKSKKLEIYYSSNEDLELIMDKIGVKAV